MSSKGQTFMPDFSVSILVFGIILSIFLFSWNSIADNRTTFSVEEEINRDAYYTTTFLVTTSGYPDNWSSENVQIPGFAKKDNLLSTRKIKQFGQLSYSEQKDLLQTSDFSLNISSDEQPDISFGKYSEGARTVVPVRRKVLIESPDTSGEVMWMYDPAPNKSDAIMGINFTLDSGSEPVSEGSLNSLELEVDTSSEMFSNTSADTIVSAGVDRNNDGAPEIDLTNNITEWEVEVEDKNELQMDFSAPEYSDPQPGDSILVELGEVDNPSAGEYDSRVRGGEDGTWISGDLGIGEEHSLENQVVEAELQLVVWRQ